jgi:hypothetical protein
MTSLARDLRKALEKTVKQARRAAEAGARKAVEQLSVGEGDAPKHLPPDQRTLRNRLRAHGRQLGDRRDTKSGTQATSRLVQECAYEHWHRMLFARFLAENDLLIEPKSGVAITLDDARELAREQVTDWLEVASGFAERMLPQIFRKGDPVLDIALPPEARSELEDLLKKLPPDVFQADDSLGWVYQFWQSDKKDAINRSETKIGADELPAVTQLFTEDYMVLFLLHNTLGAWWAGKVLKARPDLAKSSKNEADLRAACKVGDVEWTYLRFVREAGESDAEDLWRPAAGTFDGWPRAAREVTVLDPCMGSGHFLVFALPILVAFRMTEEKISYESAVLAVLRDNLFGLEIDPRCTQIAAFNLAFAVWRTVGYRPLPPLNLACSGLAVSVTKAEWLVLAGRAAEIAGLAAKGDIPGPAKDAAASRISERAQNGLERLYDLFAKAPWLGSLIEPRRSNGDLFTANFAELEPLLAPILAATTSDDMAEMAVAAQGITKAAELLGQQFTLIVTNVPYLGRRRQQEMLRSYCNERYPASKLDLATCFVDRAVSFCQASGAAALVFPQNALFLRTYKEFRQKLLTELRWQACIRLGARGFQTPMYDFGVTLTIFVNAGPSAKQSFAALDAGTSLEPEQKARSLVSEEIAVIPQRTQLSNPGSAIVFEAPSDFPLLEEYADSYQGAGLADITIYRKLFWEIQHYGRIWALHQSSPSGGAPFTGMHFIARWEEGQGTLVSLPEATIRGKKAWGKRGVACTVLGNLPVGFYLGTLFDNSAAAIIPKDPSHLGAIWCFLSSPVFLKEVRSINQKTHVADATLVKVPFDFRRWEDAANRQYPDGLPRPYTDDPTQWLFCGHPKSSEHELQVALSRLVGYSWPRQNGITVGVAETAAADGLERHADEDGIVCLSALQGKPPAAQRLNDLLADAFGAEWSAARLASLLVEAGFDGKTLDDWLRDGFFSQHCELFRQRPFVWHIWDGRRDGFHALVNYHRLAAPNGEGRRTLERLLYSYLGDWINRQRSDQKASVEGADGRLAAAEHLRAELTKIIEGKPPYDIFIRWKPLHRQPIGWEPDINDGVRVNIRPFMTARPPAARGANRCILRATPKVKWDKDRGREPTREKEEQPWFWSWDGATEDFRGGPVFDGIRWSDLHYSHSMKQDARDRKSEGSRGKT